MTRTSARTGSALIVALWTLLLLALLLGSLAFDMHVEAAVTSFRRRRARAELLARSGVAYAQWMLAERRRVPAEWKPEEMDEATYVQLRRLSRNLPLREIVIPMSGRDEIRLTIEPESARRNVNALETDDWYEVLYRGGVPEEFWDELIACFQDWTDPDDEHRLLGAEADDPFYEERGYGPRNAPVETIAELVMIKGFSRELVYGGPSPYVEGETLPGIARWLTTRGDGRLNVNAAEREVLLTLPGLAEADADAIIEAAKGADGEPGTEDDGFADAAAFAAVTGMANPLVLQRLTFERERYFRVTSAGVADGGEHRVIAVIRAAGDNALVIEWMEGTW